MALTDERCGGRDEGSGGLCMGEHWRGLSVASFFFLRSFSGLCHLERLVWCYVSIAERLSCRVV